MVWFKLLFFLIILASSFGMSYYEYFSADDGSFSTGLTAEGESFKLNGKDILILSGAFHYFRIHPKYWRRTFKKLRAAGLNTVDTYMPWNLHNPRIGVFDYGSEEEDMSAFLDVRSFVQIAMEEDLFVILRPGPYICSEWDFGGLPSYLLRDDSMQVRRHYDGYLKYVKEYFESFAPLLNDLLVTKGGPIIAVQIENEYGAFGYDSAPRDTRYLEYLRDLLDENGFGEALYFTSDSPASSYDWGSLDGILMTANFKTGTDEQLGMLKQLQPNRPMMVMEYWTGWFDHWLMDEYHQITSPEHFAKILEEILERNSSVNFYMFIGGTNFGFMAGANIDLLDVPGYSPTVSSYDYDAPLSEIGDYTKKYDLAVKIMEKYNPLSGIVSHPTRPEENKRVAYGSFPVTEILPFKSILAQTDTVITLKDGPINMEALDINEDSGQDYGYVVYTSTQSSSGRMSVLNIRGHVRDMAQLLINNEIRTEMPYNKSDVDGHFGLWSTRNGSHSFLPPEGDYQISLLVENLGRVNYGKPHFYIQKKGLWEGAILLDGIEIKEWEVKPLEFKRKFVKSLVDWEPFSGRQSTVDDPSSQPRTPHLYRSFVEIESEPHDTFLDMRRWTKGVVFVNGFNLGRFWNVGPTQSMYVPAPLLQKGTNEFIVFEQAPSVDTLKEITFIEHPILGEPVLNEH